MKGTSSVTMSRQRFSWQHCVQCLALLVVLHSTSSAAEDDCFFRDVGPSVSSIACSVERGAWYISTDSSAMKNAGCLLGGKGCGEKRHVPTMTEIPASPPPLSSKNKQYQALAMKAESIVPKTWWREGFADAQLLLTTTDRELPRKQFDVSDLRNKKMKNLLQCVTRQQFIRKSFAFDEEGPVKGELKCTAMADPAVASFLLLWQTGDNSVNFGGKLIKESGSERMIWTPEEESDGELLVSALLVLDHFYANYGSVWTGCFKFDKSSPCRGALAG
jgi:hypothetical protein